MTINANININNMPEIKGRGYVVAINDEGVLWFYGFYEDEDRAQEAVDEHTDRFMVEVD